MGLFSSKASSDDDDMIGIWGALSDSGKPGKHHGGNMHGTPKGKPTGKHHRPVKGGKPAKGTGKKK